MDLVTNTLHYLGNNKKDAFVLQIGAMDGINFDDTRGFLDLYRWKALLVEPIPDIFNELKKNFGDRENYIFEQSAITTYDGEVTMLTIPPNTIINEDLHPGYKGMSAIYPLKNGFGTTYQRDIDVKANFGVDLSVPCLTLDSLLKKHNVNNIDILICDAEGHDWLIFDQLDFNLYRPSFIRLEYINLTDEEKKLTEQKLVNNGYVVSIGQDIDAVDQKLYDLLYNETKITIPEVIKDEIVSDYILKYGSDKNKSGYSFIYERLFRPLKDSCKNILEIGIGTLDPSIPSSFAGISGHIELAHYKQGGSLRAWRDYFKNANIYGVDVAEDCKFTEERIETNIFSSLDVEASNKYLKDKKFDIIIDDGLHTGDGQLQTIINFFDSVVDNGIYVIEDCGGGGDGKNVYTDNSIELKKIIDKHEYYFGGNILVIKKNYSNVGHTSTLTGFIGDNYIAPVEVKIIEEPIIDESILFVDNLTKAQREVLKMYLMQPEKIKITNKNLTVTTGLWDINRTGRDFTHYIENFKKFLKIPVYMVIFIEQKYEYLVWETRTKENTLVKLFELSDIQNIYAPFWNKTQEIRTSESWLNLTGENGWLKSSPQATIEWYNPIVQSKMFMLHDATIWNPFKTDYFIWLDAGITNTVYENYFIEDRVLDKINPYLENFLFLSYPYESSGEIHGFKFDEMNKFASKKVKYVCRGGLFGGSKDSIHEANSEYYNMLDITLRNNLMGTEESVFTILSYLRPDMYRRYELDSNGLIVKFVENLLKDNITLSVTQNKQIAKISDPNISKYKVSIYMLTFNFPEQIEHTLKTWRENSPDWLDKPRKILIDNSTSEEARIGNKAIADKWGFEHIIRNENTGINGGRLFAAEHFDESDSDFYFFFEDDMGLHPSTDLTYCRNGFRKYIPNLYEVVQKIMVKEGYDFLKLSYTEVYMDNNIQVSWYNIPKALRSEIYPDYDVLPISGIDPNSPRTKFNNINLFGDVSYIDGEIYYANWPMIVNKAGNKKMFLETKWARPYEQTWMSYMFQETIKENIRPAILLASPVKHDRILCYEPEERREN